MSQDQFLEQFYKKEKDIITNKKMNALLLHPELGITKLECRQTIESMLQQNTNNNTAHHMKINKIHSKIIQRMAQYSRVNSRMDLDNNSH